MSRFRKSTHALCYCPYHTVWVPKYRYRVLERTVGREVHNGLRGLLGPNGCEGVEVIVEPEHGTVCHFGLTNLVRYGIVWT